MASEWSCASPVGAGSDHPCILAARGAGRRRRAAIMRIMLNSPEAAPTGRPDPTSCSPRDGVSFSYGQRAGARRREHRGAHRRVRRARRTQRVGEVDAAADRCSACSRPASRRRRAVRRARPATLRDRWRVGYVPQRLRIAPDLPATVEEVVADRPSGQAGLVAARAAPPTARPSTTRSSRSRSPSSAAGGSASSRAASSSAR